MNQSPFLFTACQQGAERALKAELSRAYPAWRFAFSRPGFLTFKWMGDREPMELSKFRSIFARSFGWSSGMLVNDPATDLAATLAERWEPHQKFSQLHVWQRSLIELPDGVPSVTTVTESQGEFIERVRQTLVSRGCLSADMTINQPAQFGQEVCNLVHLDEQRWALGWHRVDAWEQQWPGGVPPLVTHDKIVSRAYFKMREALLWSGLPCRPGDRCVEIGSAPGGACQALLEDGLYVTGIDPAPMHLAVLAHPHFTHIQKRGADLKRREYADCRWLFVDSNVAPKHTLDTVEAIVQSQHTQIEGMILTLKLMDWKLADHLVDYAHRVRGWGFPAIRCRQLACNHQEVCLVAKRTP